MPLGRIKHPRRDHAVIHGERDSPPPASRRGTIFPGLRFGMLDNAHAMTPKVSVPTSPRPPRSGSSETFDKG